MCKLCPKCEMSMIYLWNEDVFYCDHCGYHRKRLYGEDINGY
jgi:Zn ribbon nucleic-acid-binding protein